MDIEEFKNTPLFNDVRKKVKDVELFYTEIVPNLIDALEGQKRMGKGWWLLEQGHLSDAFEWEPTAQGRLYWLRIDSGLV